MKSLYGSINSITTRSILTHHSGFPSDMLGVNSDNESYKNVINYLNEQYTAFPTNYLRIYSNIGYCFLGYELEKVSKSDYSEYISQNIFEPLGMRNSFVAIDSTLMKKVSRTYNSQKEQKDESYTWVTPAGGIYSNVAEMGLFIQSWLQDKSPLLNATTINAIFQPQNKGVEFNLGSEYGIGWDLKKSKYNYIAEHGGSTFSFRAQIAVNRYAGLGVIILSNSANAGSFTWRASEIIDKASNIKGVAVNEIPPFDPGKIIQKEINLTAFQGNYGQNMSWFPLLA